MKLSDFVWRLRLSALIGAGAGIVVGVWATHSWVVALLLAFVGGLAGMMLAPAGRHVIERD